MAKRPLRNDGVTMRYGVCVLCGRQFTPSGRRRFCSPTCRQAAWRRRHPSPLPPPLLPLSTRAPRQATVYECPTCDARYLGQQRCDDCQRFCRRIGPGGLCPHCEEPVALADLTP